MKKLLIVCVIAAMGPIVVIPTMATAAGYGGNVTCTPSTQSGATCDDKQDVFKRLYDLEVKVQMLQAQNAQLEAKIGATAMVQGVGSYDSRISALESKFDGLRGLLIQVVAMLTQVLAKLH